MGPQGSSVVRTEQAHLHHLREADVLGPPSPPVAVSRGSDVCARVRVIPLTWGVTMSYLPDEWSGEDSEDGAKARDLARIHDDELETSITHIMRTIDWTEHALNSRGCTVSSQPVSARTTGATQGAGCLGTHRNRTYPDVRADVGSGLPAFHSAEHMCCYVRLVWSESVNS